MTYVMICRECGKEFDTVIRTQRICSDKCRVERRTTYQKAYREIAAHDIKEIRQAIKEIRQEYEKKLRELKRSRTHTHCVECGKELDPKHRRTKLCSGECSRKRKKRMSSDRQRDNRKMASKQQCESRRRRVARLKSYPVAYAAYRVMLASTRKKSKLKCRERKQEDQKDKVATESLFIGYLVTACNQLQTMP